MDKKKSFLTNYNEIRNLLDQYKIENYYIWDNGIVDINGDVNLQEQNFNFFPIKFGYVKGNFDCAYCYDLKTLEGAPKKCKDFNCDSCINLKNLKGAPEECNFFNCSQCISLKSLKGAPKKCKDFMCFWCNSLKTLKGAPEKCETFDCSYCKELIALEGAPKKCKKFMCQWCEKLKNLKNAPKKCDYFNCSYCKEVEYSFKYFPKVKQLEIKSTPFEKLYNLIDTDIFLELVNIKTDINFEAALLKAYINNATWDTIFPLLKDKTMTEEAFKHKYRGAVAGNKYVF